MKLLDPRPYMELTPADIEAIAIHTAALIAPMIDGLRAAVLEQDTTIKKRWLSFNDVCKVCGITRYTLSKWIECGQFPAGHIVGCRRKWSIAEIDRAIVRKRR